MPEAGLDEAKDLKATQKVFLTIEEISAIRSDVVLGILKGKKYQTDDAEVSVVETGIDPDKFQDETDRDEILALFRNKEKGEVYPYERFIVNALLEQPRIARKFGLPRKSLLLDLRSDYLSRGTSVFDHEGNLHRRVLAKHIEILKNRGATDEQLIIELAGHIFHEAIHDVDGDLEEVLFGGKTSLGEITSVTAQMAYYLEEEYHGPTSYDFRRYQAGLAKIKNGENFTRDYDIATCIAGQLLLRALKESYPESQAEGEEPIAQCEKIVAGLSTEERQKLIPCLKKAIEQSADENGFNTVVETLRKEKTDSNSSRRTDP
ncbi:hypothetical protein A3I53_03360 [Candidatus Curtissbacteria bacterium RIFCSPLOWO2_02_FULL_40_13b]|uniref:Uncharacterized protein n=2 Tax=Candidatus Curtissiibacteriota TaxID=1752717 RepID=A0A1F5HSX6_9BACT|nr:MAG: hypothetical protein A2693_02190 [Candidatus Curtissbacteria bacterium RIFCSPHIGHO2_01_FULL_40_12]OGE07079.1 MAG: hypothetical protein A3I53_03360 [Candidatus Curtissbacteria bacterium RIFCSPLOWO2_02_FULL_40_13b]